MSPRLEILKGSSFRVEDNAATLYFPTLNRHLKPSARNPKRLGFVKILHPRPRIPTMQAFHSWQIDPSQTTWGFQKLEVPLCESQLQRLYGILDIERGIHVLGKCHHGPECTLRSNYSLRSSIFVWRSAMSCVAQNPNTP